MAIDTIRQTEIDQLLAGGNHLTPRSAASQPDVQLYDFRRPARVSKERLRTLEAMYERLVKNLEAWLIARVRGHMEIRLQSVEQFSYGEFTLSLPTPCSSFVFDVAGTGHKGVIDVGQEFAFFIIDRLFGGEGQGTVPFRSLTPLERMAVRSISDRVTQLLQEIWQDHVPMELEITGFESSPDILQVSNRDDPVLVANVEITAGNITSLLLICMPFSVLDKFFASGGVQRHTLTGGTDQQREVARQRNESSLRHTKVPLFVRLPEFQLSMRDIAQMQVGSVVPTGIPKDARIIVRAGTQERFLGSPGRVGGHLAVRITDSVQGAPNSSDPSST
jgi:flagellar motor switch protein FliM